MLRKLFWVVAALALCGPAAQATVKPHALISENMVLQQGVPVKIWGTADADEKVTVAIQDQTADATAQGGKWAVTLKPLKAGGPFTLTIKGSNTIELKNVLVGEVWVCSGQSNMEWPLAATADAQKAIEAAANPNVRLFTVPKRVADQPEADVNAQWQECNPNTVKNFSAVGYFFGRDLNKARNVPVGLIHTSWGGTIAEAWTSKEALESNPDLKILYERHAAGLTKSVQALKEWQEAAKKAKDAGEQAPKMPGTNPNQSTALYNGMIAPLLPYAIKGAIWYQGESNAGRAYQYRTLFPAMIQDWRKHWGVGEFPFLFVQLAPWRAKDAEPKDSDWAELREAQLLTTQTCPNTGMAVITDVGDEKDIHPRQKEPVGARLALAARHLGYGEDLVYSGPVYDKMQVQGGKIILSFKHVGGGLVAKDGRLTGFAIAGDDKKFVNAEAEIEGDRVVVFSPTVAKPVAVRFGWANFPVVNLFNKAGLPATPFRTDDWPGVTAGKK